MEHSSGQVMAVIISAKRGIKKHNVNQAYIKPD